MECIGEGYLAGFNLELSDDEKKVLVKSLMSYLQFCNYFSHLSRIYRDVTLCESLLSKLGVTGIECSSFELKL